MNVSGPSFHSPPGTTHGKPGVPCSGDPASGKLARSLRGAHLGRPLPTGAATHRGGAPATAAPRTRGAAHPSSHSSTRPRAQWSQPQAGHTPPPPSCPLWPESRRPSAPLARASGTQLCPSVGDTGQLAHHLPTSLAFATATQKALHVTCSGRDRIGGQQPVGYALAASATLRPQLS